MKLTNMTDNKAGVKRGLLGKWVLAGAFALGMALAVGSPTTAYGQGLRRVAFPPADSPPIPPQKAPERTSNSGEDTGILPDYGPSQRKTKENSPPPPNNITLLTKLKYGEPLEYNNNGTIIKFEPWESYKNDGYTITTEATGRLDNGVLYQYDTKDLKAPEGFDPATISILYMTGDYDFKFTDAEVVNVRNYLLGGGTIIFNAARGQEDFTNAVKREMKRVFKDKTFMMVPLDHAIYNAKYKLSTLLMMANGQAKQAAPEILSIDIGTRAAAILVPYGLGSALAGLDPGNYERRGKHYVGESAKRLSINLIAYSLGSTSYGKFLSQEFPTYNGKTTPGDTVKFAQVKYAGSWDVNPAIQNMVIQGVYENTSDRNGRPAIQVDYTPTAVTLDSPDLGAYPAVFMTGHYDFKLTEAEKTGLRDYLLKGGTLIVSSAAGLKPFDTAFKREIKEVIPSSETGGKGGSADAYFVPITPSSPMFAGGWNKMDRVEYTPYSKSLEPNLDYPRFYGVYIDGRLAVIYTPYDLMSGVNRESNGYAKGLSNNDAMKAMINIVTYALAN
jgi:hypothetical protein